MTITCPTCGKIFRVDREESELISKKCICKVCGTSFTFPNASLDKIVFSSTDFQPIQKRELPEKIVIGMDDFGTARPQPPIRTSPPPLPKPKPVRNLSPRQKRLQADFEDTIEFFCDFPLIRICRYEGDPPEKYLIEYYVRGIESILGGQIRYRDVHQVEIVLGSDYPRGKPRCKLLTPIYHPNINPTFICIGDHWAAQERLHHLIVRIGEMLTYQSYNVKSPLNGSAAEWADKHSEQLPVDSRDLTPPDRK